MDHVKELENTPIDRRAKLEVDRPGVMRLLSAQQLPLTSSSV